VRTARDQDRLVVHPGETRMREPGWRVDTPWIVGWSWGTGSSPGALRWLLRPGPRPGAPGIGARPPARCHSSRHRRPRRGRSSSSETAACRTSLVVPDPVECFDGMCRRPRPRRAGCARCSSSSPSRPPTSTRTNPAGRIVPRLHVGGRVAARAWGRQQESGDRGRCDHGQRRDQRPILSHAITRRPGPVPAPDDARVGSTPGGGPWP